LYPAERTTRRLLCFRGPYFPDSPSPAPQAQSWPREIGNAWGFIGNLSLAVQEKFNVFAEGSGQRRTGVTVEFFENGANSAWEIKLLGPAVWANK
jgi:hypothetical protein